MADDWDKPTIIRKSKPTSKDLKSSAVLNKAIASGQVEVTKRGKSIYLSPIHFSSFMFVCLYVVL